MRLARMAVLAAVVSAPLAAGAQAPRRMAVLVLGSGGLSAETADSLTEVLIAALVARGGVEVVGKEEFQAQLGTDEQASQSCLDSTSCLGRVGVQLGVDEVVAGSVGPRRGGGYTMSLNRIEISTTVVKGRVFEQVDGDEQALVAAIQRAARGIYETPVRAGELRVTSNAPRAQVYVDDEPKGSTPLTLRDLAPGRHAVRVERRGWTSWSGEVDIAPGRTETVEATLEESADGNEGGGSASGLAIAATIAGGALAIGGGVAGYVFATSSQETIAEPSGVTQVEAQRRYDEFYDARETDALIANVSFGVAGAALLFTSYMVLFQSDAVFGGGGSEDRARLAIGPLAGGGVETRAVVRW